MFILDTNVVSELRKSKSGKADQNVIAWAAKVPVASLYLSVVTVLEMEMGVLLIERRDATQGAVLRNWLDHAVWPAFTSRILVIDTDVAKKCANLHVPDPRAERDALIAATALVHDMTVATRNVSDFVTTGVRVLNPWSSQV